MMIVEQLTWFFIIIFYLLVLSRGLVEPQSLNGDESTSKCMDHQPIIKCKLMIKDQIFNDFKKRVWMMLLKSSFPQTSP